MPVPYLPPCDRKVSSRVHSENNRSTHVDKMGNEPRVIVTLDGLHDTNRQWRSTNDEHDRPILRRCCALSPVVEADGVGTGDEV